MRKMALIAAVLLSASLLTGCCMHDWQDATCTEPKTCVKCGETEGEKLGHDYSELTCTEDSVCANCGDTKKALGHTFVGCVCKVCGETQNPNFRRASFEASSEIEVRYGDTFLALDSNPYDEAQSAEDQAFYGALAYDSICEVNNYFELPDSINDKVAHTSMLDGVQSETHGIIKTTWSYSDYTGVEIMWEIAQ